jgi:hypothetical integral membrane protein (TIGR02206 family)
VAFAAQYWLAVALLLGVGAIGCVSARRSRAAAVWVGRAISAVLAADAVAFLARPVIDGDWTARSSLPLDLCDAALLVAAVACLRPSWQRGVEITYFWGMAGTLQAVLTPDLSVGFPHLQFIAFVVGHVGIVIAVGYLIFGLRLRPRRGAAAQVFMLTLVYTAAVGVVDWLSGANYMYLRHAPAHSSLISVLGPWPWYIASVAGVAVVLFALLDLPFRNGRKVGTSTDALATTGSSH